jgi:DNA-binding transcriptional LysR family regulator
MHLYDLRDEDFVSLRLGSSIFVDAMYQACISARFKPHIVQQVVEVPAILNLVAAGLGVSVVPESTARQWAGALVICKLLQKADAPEICSDVYLVHHGREHKPVVLEFVRSLVHWAQQRR